MMWAENNPCAHETIPSTWSCQNTVPESTSENQRCLVNSTVTHSPGSWLLSSGRSKVSWLPLIAAMVRISISGVPNPIAIAIPGRSGHVVDLIELARPAAASDPPLSGKTDCS